MQDIFNVIKGIDWSNCNVIIIAGALAVIVLALLLWCIISSSKAKKNKKLYRENLKVSIECLKSLINTIDSKDPFTKGHSSRVADYTVEIARRMGLGNLDNIYYIGLLHDVGKIGIPDDILKRVGRLMPEEYTLMKQHTEFGRIILNDISDLPGVVEGAKYHHEHYDGTGYNEGLKGKDIPLIGRIIAVADSYDAMTSPRSYRRGLSKSEAMNELVRCSGTQFDPEIAQIMLKMLNDGFNPN